MGLAREIFLRASHSEWLADQLTRRSFTKKAVQRFLPGEDLDSALEATAALGEKRIPTILTLLGEDVTTTEEADAVAEHFLGILDRVDERGFDSDVSIKPTHFGIDIDFEAIHERVERLVRRAGKLGRMVAVDVEDSSYVDRTIDLYRRLREAHPNVALCLQAYLHRTPADLDSLFPLAPTIRLVKGAYNEPHHIAYRRKKDVDAAFLKLADSLLQEARRGTGTRVFFGTHDPRMIEGVCRRAEELGLPKDGFEIQMLYGIQRELQTRLSADGYRVRVLISYGDSWFPWYMRRLAERPANMLFLMRSLLSR